MPTGLAGSRLRIGRIAALDGLRGVAALVVVIHHTLLLSNQFIRPYRDPEPNSFGDVYWWLTYTPLHVLWDGAAAVFVFFVLSGFVLALPSRSRPINWRSYYPARLIRLYVPVWAAVGIAVVWTVSITHSAEGSSWLSGHAPLSPSGILRDVTLVLGRPGSVISVLWSLKWEVIFSLLLPLYIVFAARFQNFFWGKLAAVLVLIIAGAYLGPSSRPYAMQGLFQLPIFALGCLMAMEWERLQTMRSRAVATFRHSDLALAGASVLLLSSYWILYALPLSREALAVISPASRALQVGGATLLVFLVASQGRTVAVFGTRPIVWLGTRSFSLYLVHEPLVVAFGNLVGSPPNPALALLVTVPVSLLMAEIFFRLIERPSHLLSATVSRRLYGQERRL
jgi:peptidoglycan/LPS O-acetylase OafA/YrhL